MDGKRKFVFKEFTSNFSEFEDEIDKLKSEINNQKTIYETQIMNKEESFNELAIKHDIVKLFYFILLLKFFYLN